MVPAPVRDDRGISKFMLARQAAHQTAVARVHLAIYRQQAGKILNNL